MDNVMQSDGTIQINIDEDLYKRLLYLGIIPDGNPCREGNVGKSDYAEHVIQPWAIWLDYPHLTSWDHDIIKRILRTKTGESKDLDYRKIQHICEERIRQMSYETSGI